MTRLLQSLLRRMGALRDVVMPRMCPVCGGRMGDGEEFCCTRCLVSLPYTGFRGAVGNPLERLFLGLFPIGRASAWFYYNRGSDSRNLVLSLKYHRRLRLAAPLGRALAFDLEGTDFFTGIDALVPVPLSRERRRKRGFNVCDEIADGVAQVTRLPVWKDAVQRVVDNPTQTTLIPYERKENVDGIFAVPRAEVVRGRHLLLIDDVVTTGATAASCAAALAEAGAARISVLALAVSGTVARVPPPRDEDE